MSPSGDGLLADLFLGRPRSRRYPKFNIRRDIPRIASGGAIASLTLTAVLQAVDGIALKAMVDAWAGAESSEKAGLFHAAFGVRQVEVGLASVMSMFFGLTVTLYGIALWNSGHYPRWVAVLALLGGIPTLVGGVVMAYTGFSSLAMTVNMPASLLILVWIVGCVPRSVEKERRPPLRHQSIRSGGNLRVFENLARTLVAVDAS